MKTISIVPNYQRHPNCRLLISGLICLIFLNSANAQDLTDISNETGENREITHDAIELADLVKPRPVTDSDTVDTVIVFTNATKHPAKIVCSARNHNGESVGRAWAKVPGHGLSFIRASDLSDGEDFLGHSECKARGRLRVTGFLLGAGLTNVAVQQHYRRNRPRPLTDSAASDSASVPIRPRGVTTVAHIPVVASF